MSRYRRRTTQGDCMSWRSRSCGMYEGSARHRDHPTPFPFRNELKPGFGSENASKQARRLTRTLSGGHHCVCGADTNPLPTTSSSSTLAVVCIPSANEVDVAIVCKVKNEIIVVHRQHRQPHATHNHRCFNGLWAPKSTTNRTASFKTQMCNNHAKNPPCPFGEACMFAHGDGEIRMNRTPPSSRSIWHGGQWSNRSQS
jgi:hypothetical protein